LQLERLVHVQALLEAHGASSAELSAQSEIARHGAVARLAKATQLI
jgi:hypothetical protein